MWSTSPPASIPANILFPAARFSQIAVFLNEVISNDIRKGLLRLAEIPNAQKEEEGDN